MTAIPLAGTTILVTRPAAHAAELCRRLQELGGAPVPLPTLLIEPVRPSPALDAALSMVPVADWAIFASRNAVSYGLQALAERGLRLSPRTRIATVGTGTARALRDKGYAVTCKPSQGFNTEALLDTPGFEVAAGERVLIFRGEGGRPLLAETLKARGASVRFVEVYRRSQPQLDVAQALSVWRRGQRRWVIVTSSEGLGNLLQMAGAAAGELQQAGLVTVSERIAATARRGGWRGAIEVAAEPGDAGLVEALMR